MLTAALLLPSVSSQQLPTCLPSPSAYLSAFPVPPTLLPQVLFAGDSQGVHWSEVDRTDVVANNLSERWHAHGFTLGAFLSRAVVLNHTRPAPPHTHPTPPDPDFRKPLLCTFQFESLQHMRVVVYDADTRGDPAALRLADQDFLGEGTFLLSDLLTAPGQSLAVQLYDAQRRPLRGCVAELLAEELPNTNAVVGGGWQGAGLPWPHVSVRQQSGRRTALMLRPPQPCHPAGQPGTGGE